VGDGTDLDRALYKKIRKNPRLQKVGELSFRRLHTVAELEAILDQIIACYDARQQAIHHCPPFAHDPMKRAFCLGLMQTPQLLHSTVLTAGDQFVAAGLSVCDSATVHLGIHTYAQQFERYSPGVVYLLHLGTHLARTGMRTLDLTPGEDVYKERLANAWDEVLELKICFSGWQAWRERAERGVRALARNVLGALGRKRPQPQAAALANL
jgi:CelD/BcsL family acetyltransferase involved in cellulose biosynthesis